MSDPIPPSQPISAPVVDPSYSNPTISHSGGIVADPNIDNSMYGDEYGDYGTYEEGGDGSYDASMMAGAATADGNKGRFSYMIFLEYSTEHSLDLTICKDFNYFSIIKAILKKFFQSQDTIF